MKKPSLIERCIGVFVYLVIIFSLIWITGIFIDLVIFYVVKNKYIKFHALQAGLIGLLLVVIMSIVGFLIALIFPSQNIQEIIKLIGISMNIVFLIFAGSIVIKREIRIKTISNYVFG